MDKKISIAIDGPAAAGKSTIAKIVANKLSYLYIDTGAMYRALTLIAIEKGIGVNDEQALTNVLNQVDIDLQQRSDGQKVFVNEEDVTEEIRNDQVTNQVSHIAKHPSIRLEMVRRQQELAKDGGVVMDGRDIGTHVLPDAEIKIFLIASVEERAKRRYKENLKKGFTANFEQLKKEIEQRDLIDSKREASPLVKAKDAIEIDTTSLSINSVVNKIITIVNQII